MRFLCCLSSQVCCPHLPGSWDIYYWLCVAVVFCLCTRDQNAFQANKGLFRTGEAIICLLASDTGPLNTGSWNCIQALMTLLCDYSLSSCHVYGHKMDSKAPVSPRGLVFDMLLQTKVEVFNRRALNPHIVLVWPFQKKQNYMFRDELPGNFKKDVQLVWRRTFLIRAPTAEDSGNDGAFDLAPLDNIPPSQRPARRLPKDKSVFSHTVRTCSLSFSSFEKGMFPCHRELCRYQFDIF